MFKLRIQQIRQKLQEENLDGVLISAVSNITYLTGYANFSKEEREAYIFIGKDFAYIITDGRYTEAIKRQVPHLTLFERVNKKSTKNLFKKHEKEIKRLGIEEDNLTVAEHKILTKHFKNIKHFDDSNLRSIKTEEEINKIEKACSIGDLAFEFILKKIKIGVTEKEVAKKLEDFIRSKGALISFPPIVAFGKNSAIPHHQTGETILGPSTFLRQAQDRSGQGGLFILLDFGVKYENYCSDMTRTIICGKATMEQKKIYKTVLEAQKQAVEFIHNHLGRWRGNDLDSSEVDKSARDHIASQGYTPYSHGLGHGIGLQVHEPPFISEKSNHILKEGMVFSIEPGIYLPDFGGVRIEDLFVYERGSLRQLTHSPKQLIVI